MEHVRTYEHPKGLVSITNIGLGWFIIVPQEVCIGLVWVLLMLVIL